MTGQVGVRGVCVVLAKRPAGMVSCADELPWSELSPVWSSMGTVS